MNISMYQASVPRFVNILGNLSKILDKAQAHVDAKKIDADVLPSYRLFPDMLPMTQAGADRLRHRQGRRVRASPASTSPCSRTTRRRSPS